MVSDLMNGEIPDHWEFTTLGVVCQRGGGSIQTGPFGSQLHASDYVSDGIPSIMPTNIGDNRIVEDGIVRINEEDANRLSQHRLRAGDIIYSRRGDIEKRALIREREEGWLCGTGCLKVRLGSGVVDPLFGSMFLGHPAIREWIVRHAVGATMPNLNTSIMSAVPFAIPPIAEQKAIAAVLGTLDDKIEMNRRMNATLEAMARALFQSWFVDFDPVRAKLDGREPGGLDSNTAALFPQYLDNSTLGIIPKGWQVNRISEVVEEVFDGPHATPPHVEEGPIFLGIKNLTGSALALSDTRYISESDWPRWTKRVTPKPLDIVFSYEATLGFFALIPPGLRCCLGRRLALIRPRAEDGHSHFWFHQFIGPDFQRYLIQHSVQGATVDRIPLIQFPNYFVLNPPSALKEAFECRVAPLWAKIHTNAKQSRTLATLRDTLLPKLLSGELSVETTKN